jgi:hypothetical protein
MARMIERFRERFGKQKEAHVYENTLISPSAERAMSRLFSKEDMQEVLSIFDQLPPRYQNAEGQLERIASTVIEYNVTGFSILPPYIYKLDYALNVGFDPSWTKSGSCDELIQHFFYRLHEAEIDKKLPSRSRMFIADVQTPPFFSQKGANHVAGYITLPFSNNGILFDPSFGIISMLKNSDYTIKHSTDITKKIESFPYNEINGDQKKPFEITGHPMVVRDGGVCHAYGEEPDVFDSPNLEYTLGLSKDKQTILSLGFDGDLHHPLICVSFPNSNYKEIYWLYRFDNNETEIHYMTSEWRRDPSIIANPERADEIHSLLLQCGQFVIERRAMEQGPLEPENNLYKPLFNPLKLFDLAPRKPRDITKP